MTLGGLAARYRSVSSKMPGRKYYEEKLTHHRLELDESGDTLSDALEQHWKHLTTPNVVTVPSIRIPINFRQISLGFRQSHNVTLYTEFEMALTPMNIVSPRREYTVTVTKKPFGFKVNMAKMSVKSLTQKGPAQAAGVKLGSRILRIDGRPVNPYNWAGRYKRARVPFKVTFAHPRKKRKSSASVFRCSPARSARSFGFWYAYDSVMMFDETHCKQMENAEGNPDSARSGSFIFPVQKESFRSDCTASKEHKEEGGSDR